MKKELIKIIQGDCLELMQGIPAGSIDLVLCDLPYGITDCSWDKRLSLEQLWMHYNRIIKKDGTIALFGTQPFIADVIESNRKKFKYCWYWVKTHSTGALFAKKQPMRCVEEIAIFRQSGSGTYNPQGLIKLDRPKPIKKTTVGKVYAGFRGKPKPQEYTNYPNNVLNFGRDSVYCHPTQKPIKLLEYLIKTYTNEGETVLDNCMGSGSTGVACVNTGRSFIGIELDEKYFKIAEQRINEVINKNRS